MDVVDKHDDSVATSTAQMVHVGFTRRELHLMQKAVDGQLAMIHRMLDEVKFSPTVLWELERVIREYEQLKTLFDNL